jgi:hypothetical protein
VRRVLLGLTLVLITASVASAQWVVNDPAVTAKNAAIAILKEYLVSTQKNQRTLIDRLARRLSSLTPLGKYAVASVPSWRAHSLPYGAYTPLTTTLLDALTAGDTTGTAWTRSTDALESATSWLRALPPADQQAFLARLASVQVADATGIAGLNDTGQLRLNGRREQTAINALENDVTDPSSDQSASAVLDKISGASLIGTRQRQAREQLLAAVLEQLVLDNKRARDTEVASLNMQNTQWRIGRAANDAFVSGTGDALRTWRQR